MVFYLFLGIVALLVVWMIVRSPQFRQLMRGRGADAGRYGSQLDHFFEQQGGGQGWNDDGRGLRESQVHSKHTRRGDQAL
jgi:hypothetical protein